MIRFLPSFIILLMEKEPRDDFKFQAQLDRLLKMAMIYEHSLLGFSHPLSDNSPVWSYLKTGL